MSIPTFGSQELNQRPGNITSAVDRVGEAIVTKRGIPTYRIVRIEPPESTQTLWELMSGLERSDVEVEFPALDGALSGFEE